jgi:hypothetical protein
LTECNLKARCGLRMQTLEVELASPNESPGELARERIHRSRGSTASERLLADLGEQAFLNLWSYPNLFYDKKQNGKGDGKELCDLLVVCGHDVIIFSDKHIKYRSDMREGFNRRSQTALLDTPADVRAS